MSKGFTLVEVSIVLIIIGLLAGGVLIGRDLIHAAEVRATVSQIEATNTAVHTFKSKYDCLPGDCFKAVDFGLGIAGGAGDNGNGDDSISFGITASSVDESLDFWYHLSQAGLIAGTYPGFTGQSTVKPGVDIAQIPLSKAGILVGPAIFSDVGNTDLKKAYYWLIGKVEHLSDAGGAQQIWGSIPPEDNYAIDAKIDDGLPATGKVTVSASIHTNLITYSDPSSIIANLNVPSGNAIGAYGSLYMGQQRCADNSVTPPVYNVRNKSGEQATLCTLQILPNGF